MLWEVQGEAFGRWTAPTRAFSTICHCKRAHYSRNEPHRKTMEQPHALGQLPGALGLHGNDDAAGYAGRYLSVVRVQHASDEYTYQIL